MKQLLYLPLLSLLLTFQFLLAQAPDTLWTKTFGGDNYDWTISVQQTLDLGYIIAGYTLSTESGVGNTWIIKTDTNGKVIWTNTFGGSNISDARFAHQTSDGGYIIIGSIPSSRENTDIWLIKTDEFGDSVWTKTFGGEKSDYGFFVQQTSDGGYILTGGTESYGKDSWDLWIIKTDIAGDTIWTKTFGGIRSDVGETVVQTTDGGYLITGSTESFGSGNNDAWIIKTDSLGNLLWERTYGGSDDDLGISGRQTSDGGYIITGCTKSYGAGSNDVWLIKTNSEGDTIWTKTFGGNADDLGHSVEQTSEDGYIITGYTLSYGEGSNDVWLIKTNTVGDILWTKTFGGRKDDKGYFVQQISDGGYIITGSTESYGVGLMDAWLIRVVPDTCSISMDEFKKY